MKKITRLICEVICDLLFLAWMAGARGLSPGAMIWRRERMRLNSAIIERLNAEAEVLIAEIETARYKAGMRVLPVEQRARTPG